MKRTRFAIMLIGLGAAALVMSACDQAKQPFVKQSLASELPQPAPFETALKTDSKTENGTRQLWLCSRESGGKAARFRIVLDIPKPKQGASFVFGNGKIFREEGADGTVFLQEIAKALEAKKVSASGPRTNELSFSMAILGQKLSKASGLGTTAGSFVSDPPGDWTAIKVFVADGEGEFFLNLDAKGGKGEFSLKDTDYGDVVLGELAKVF